MGHTARLGEGQGDKAGRQNGAEMGLKMRERGKGQIDDTQHTLDDIRRHKIIAQVHDCLAKGEQPPEELCAEYKVLYERKREREKRDDT